MSVLADVSGSLIGLLNKGKFEIRIGTDQFYYDYKKLMFSRKQFNNLFFLKVIPYLVSYPVSEFSQCLAL